MPSFEQHWYIVINGYLSKPNGDETRDFVKDGYRIYPIEADLPLILNGECIGMGQVLMQIWAKGQTHLKYKLVERFDETTDRKIIEHYQNQYERSKGGTCECHE